MTIPTGASRRTFLKGAGLAAGGLLLGFTLPERARAAAARSAGAVAINAYVRIAADGAVTLVVPKSEMGQGVYTGYAQVLAEELDIGWERISVECAPVDAVYNSPFLPMQFTGGSNSLSSGFATLGRTGAAARRMLVAAAAEQLGVAATELDTEHGQVVHRASGRRLAYGALAARAATLPLPADAAPKPAAQWRLIGKPLPRLDSRAKSTGRAGFGIDVRLPGQHYAMVARAPVFGSHVASFDAAAARAVPGVVAVKQVPSGIAVIATHSWAARRGREALKVQWQGPAGAAFSSSAFAARLAALTQGPGIVARDEGNVAIAGATHVEAEFATPFLAHAAMEPLNCTVAFADGFCDVHCGTQFQTVDRAAAAAVAGLAPEQVRIHTTFLGGGFGRRANPVSDYVREAVAVAKDFPHPVMTLWTREDDMQGGYYRQQTHTRLAATLGTDGRPLAWTQVIAAQSIAAGTPLEAVMINPKTGLDATVPEGAADLPYTIPNVRVDVHQPASPVPVLWWRSVGHTYNAFAVESFVDECAHAAGADPLAYRLALLGAKSGRHRAVLELAAARAGWGTPLPPGRARGLAVHESFGSVVAEVAEVSLHDGRPRVERVVAAIHCGTAVNPNLIDQQIESAVCYGLSAALYGEVTLAEGRVQQSNFHDYEVLRLTAMPRVEVHIVPSTEPPSGVGEPGTPPIAPAVANALYALTGVRARRLPLAHTDFTKPA